MEAYCLKCREKRDMKDPKPITMTADPPKMGLQIILQGKIQPLTVARGELQMLGLKKEPLMPEKWSFHIACLFDSSSSVFRVQPIIIAR